MGAGLCGAPLETIGIYLMLTDKQRETLRLHNDEGLSFAEIAKRLGVAKQTISQRYKVATQKLADKKASLDPGVHKTLAGLGMGDMAGQHSGWVHKENPDTGEWASVYYFLGKDGAPNEVDLEEMVGRAIARATEGIQAPPNPLSPAGLGDHLLVVDIADLHIGKLCVKSETGFHYDRAEALRRGRHGLRALLTRAQVIGVAHILFVIGNDVVHIDNPRGETTSGTPQDTDGTQAVMFDDALAFYTACIEECRAVAPVSILYCPSNHDWFTGFTLARALRAIYADADGVEASEYATSHRHRKYFAFERNLIGFTHHDGAKEKDLPDLMALECIGHLDKRPRRYWYLHHMHHKIRKRGRASERRQVEKDHIGFTVIQGKAGLTETTAPEIEVVRSPSPPDGWHDRNGYVNAQAVECFLHHPADGQVARFTEWF